MKDIAAAETSYRLKHDLIDEPEGMLANYFFLLFFYSVSHETTNRFLSHNENLGAEKHVCILEIES